MIGSQISGIDCHIDPTIETKENTVYGPTESLFMESSSKI